MFVSLTLPVGKSAASLGSGSGDIARNLPDLVHPFDYYPLLIVQARSDEIADRSLKAIKQDFRRLG